MAVAPKIPGAIADDDDDTTWALSTARSLWQQGERRDAVEWLRRAIRQCAETGRDARAVELARIASDIAKMLDTAPRGLPAASRPVAMPLQRPRVVAESARVPKSSFAPPAPDVPPAAPVPADLAVAETVASVPWAEPTPAPSVSRAEPIVQTPVDAVCHAVRVFVLAGIGGATLRLARPGEAAPVGAFEAMLVSLSPEVPLLTSLQPAP